MKNYLITWAWSWIWKDITLQLEEMADNSNFFLVWWRRKDRLEETKNDIIYHKAETFPWDLFLNNEEIKEHIREILTQENVTVINSAAIMIDTLPIDKRKFYFDAQKSFVDFLSKEVETSWNKLVHISSSNVSLKKSLEKHFLLKYIIRKNINNFKYRIMKAVQEEIIQKNAWKSSIIIRPGFTDTDFTPIWNLTSNKDVFRNYQKHVKQAKMIPPSIDMPLQQNMFTSKEMARRIVDILQNHSFCKTNNVYEVIN